MRVTDRQTDTLGKNNVSPNPKGGRHNEQPVLSEDLLLSFVSYCVNHLHL